MVDVSCRDGHGEDDAGPDLFVPIDDDVEEDGESDARRRDDARLKPNRALYGCKKNKRYLFSKPGVFEYDMHKGTNRERKEGSAGAEQSVGTILRGDGEISRRCVQRRSQRGT